MVGATILDEYQKYIEKEEVDGSATYVFFDANGEELMPSKTFAYDSFDVVYDYENEGLFFVHRKFEDSPQVNGLDPVNYSILYLADNSNYMRKVFKHSSGVGGRGCGPQYVLSERPGEFIYSTGGCLAVQDHPSYEDGVLTITF